MGEVNLNLSGAQRYRQAVRKVRIRADREMREFMRGERDCLEGLFDRERAAIIAEFDRLSDELRRSHRHDARDGSTHKDTTPTTKTSQSLQQKPESEG